MKKKFAVVGCGGIAKKDIHIIQNYLNNAEIVAFCDAFLERAQSFGEK
jgi:predicted dehydrogenase